MIAFRAATLADMAAIKPVLPRRFGALFTTQILSYPAWCVTIDDVPAALCGSAPCGEHIELWFATAADFPSRYGRTAALREIFIKTALFMEEASLIVRIDDDNPAGQRMARLIGFHPTSELLGPSGPRTWLRPPVTAA